MLFSLGWGGSNFRERSSLQQNWKNNKSRVLHETSNNFPIELFNVRWINKHLEPAEMLVSNLKSPAVCVYLSQMWHKDNAINQIYKLMVYLLWGQNQERMEMVEV